MVRVLYHSVRLQSFKEINSLVYACCFKPSINYLAPLIINLEIRSGYIELEGENGYQGRMVELILNSAINLKTFQAPLSLYKELFSKDYCRNYGKKLEMLCLEDISEIEDQDVEDINHWSNLNDLPALKRLKLSIYNSERELTALGSSLTNLQELEITFQALELSFLRFLAKIAPNLTRLHLEYLDEDVPVNYCHILQAIATTNSVNSIKNLVLNDLGRVSFQDSRSIGQVLEKFTALEVLEIDFKISKNFINSISRMSNLCHFGNQSGTMDYDAVHNLLTIAVSRKLKILSIQFDIHSGAIGKRYGDAGGEVIELVVENGIIVPGRGWRRPRFNDELITKPQAMELVRIAKAKGVELRGNLVIALENEKEYEKELKWCEEGMRFFKIGREGYQKELGLN